MGLGRFLITVGVLLIVAGLVVTYGGRLPIRLGRLPGDIAIHGKNSSFYFPVTTCILLSVVLSLAMWMMRR
jgi:ribose/xylose/arabinose/galactoside ABC-type transport system permease subunit